MRTLGILAVTAALGACARGPSPAAGGPAAEIAPCPSQRLHVDGFPLYPTAAEDASLAGTRPATGGTYTFKVYKVARPFADLKAFYRKCIGPESHESEEGSFHWRGEATSTLTISKSGAGETLVRIGKVVR